jgi:hypothetical protein
MKMVEIRVRRKVSMRGEKISCCKIILLHLCNKGKLKKGGMK